MTNQSWLLLPEHVRKGKTWSYSTLHMVESCPWKYKCAKIDRLPTVPSRALLMGSLFDALCNSDASAFVEKTLPELQELYSALGGTDYDLVYNRYALYRSNILPTDQLQVPMWRELWGKQEGSPFKLPTENYLIGFADRIRDDLIVDHKFCEAPLKPVNPHLPPEQWTYKPKSGWPEQARCYMWMADRPCRFEFHVLNSVDEQIQIVPYNPRSTSVAGVPDWAMRLIAKIESGQFDPIMGYYCYDDRNTPPRWKCDYYEVCPLMDAKNDIDSELEACDAIQESE